MEQSLFTHITYDALFQIFLGAIAKLQQATISFGMSVRL